MIITGLEDGSFPRSRSVTEGAQIEEERRLLLEATRLRGFHIGQAL